MTQLTFDYQAIRAYRRLSYAPWHALAEFVDNSTQSYFNNREALDAAYASEETLLTIKIVYSPTDDRLSITDNSIGMTPADVDRAMTVGLTPEFAEGRSRYGMGLKTAACWLGDLWTVRSTQLGSTDEVTVEVNVERVANGDIELPTTVRPVDPDAHYTVIEISHLHRQFWGRTIGKISQFLASMYRDDLRQRQLRLIWRGDELQWQDDLSRFMRDANGAPLRRDFSGTTPEGQAVRGWAGVLSKGSRADAGFSILHSGRVVTGWPSSWRPEEVFGQMDGSNNLVNQRLVGEVRLDSFEVTHTKDAILWLEGQQEAVGNLINQEIPELIDAAKTARTRPRRGPAKSTISNVSRALRSTLDSSEILPEPLPADVAEIRMEEMAETASRYDLAVPSFTCRVNGRDLRAFLSDEEAPDSSFASVAESGDDDALNLVANMRHPFMKAVASTEALNTYVRVVVAFVAAELGEEDRLHEWLIRTDSAMRTVSES